MSTPKKALIAFLVLLLLLTAGCSKKLTEGEVYYKEYLPAKTVMLWYPLTISNGKTFTTRLIPYWVHYPDRYLIKIKAFVDDEWISEQYYTSNEVYDATEVGHMFEYDPDRDYEEEPCVKERAG